MRHAFVLLGLLGKKLSSAAQAQETRDASILMMLGPCTHATAPRAPVSCQGSTFELVDKSDAWETPLKWFVLASPDAIVYGSLRWGKWLGTLGDILCRSPT